MSTLINGRTPEEIKRILQWFNFDCSDHECDSCPNEDICNLQNGNESVLARDALALIERLESERDAALAKQPKWISVKDKLPPRERWVLTVNGHGRIRLMAFWKKEKERWAWIEETHFTHRNDITHWMPMPEPPKEGE